MTLAEKCADLTRAADAAGCTCDALTFDWSWLDAGHTRMRIIVRHGARCPVLLRHQAALN